MVLQEEKRARDPKYYFDKSQAQEQPSSSSVPAPSASPVNAEQGSQGADAEDGPRGKKRARAEDFL